MNKISFEPWKNKILSLVTDKINKIHEHGTFNEIDPNNFLKDKETLSYLQNMHNIFVFCPTDKAANNVAIVCQQFYAKNIIKELNLDHIDNLDATNTYERITEETMDDIVHKHITIQNQYELMLNEDMHKLPPMHWTPKIHKTPTGARFIIGSKLSSLKPLGKAITKIFKVLFHHKRRMCRKLNIYNNGRKFFWCIDNHQEVIDMLDRINNKNNAQSIATYDFSTLYTKIPHDQLIEALNHIIDSTFNDTDRQFISVGNKRAYFVKGISGRRFKYTAEDVKKCVYSLITNAYFRVGNSIFRQKIGIPMGSDPAPFFANLFLFHHEFKWLKLNKESPEAYKLFNTVRYIDDLATLNDNNVFHNNLNAIYPPELGLVLNRENDSELQGTYMDLNINIQNNRFDYKLYDKRNAFPFKIVRFPFRCSNIPRKMFFSPIQAEILRICRATAQFDSFIDSCNPFIHRMIRQGASKDSLQGPIRKIISNHYTQFSKYNHGVNQIRDQILNLI